VIASAIREAWVPANKKARGVHFDTPKFVANTLTPN
jgi:hypothetical protein